VAYPVLISFKAIDQLNKLLLFCTDMYFNFLHFVYQYKFCLLTYILEEANLQ